MAEMLTTIDVSKWQDPEQLDWTGLKKQGLKSIIIQLSHGMKREEKADQFLAKAKTEGLIAHGYHFYEGSTDEANFAVQNAQQLGLGKGAYFFLDMEGDIAGDWYQQFSVFYSLVAQSGWNPGLYVSDSPYKAKFDNDQLVSMGVYRWIASYGKEPANYDVWQYSSSNGKLDVDYDKAGKLEVDYTKNQSKHHDDSKYEPAPRQPQKPMANSWVGWGVDSSGLGGGRTIGYSTDGKNFYAVFTPWGITFRQSDADHMWELLKSRIKLPSVEGLVKKAELSNYALKSDLPDLSKFAKISDIPKVDLSGYAKITDIPSDLVHTKDLADYATKENLKAIQLTPGPPGPVGPQGIPGTPGADGKTSYFHIAYANSADGKDGFYVGGGRNLLLGTSTLSGDVANGGGIYAKGAFNGYDAVWTSTAWSERYIDLKSALGRTNAKAGDWYTISVYVKADKQIDTGSLMVCRTLGNVDANTNDGFLDGIPMQNKPITTQWQQYSWSFQINDISLQRQNTRVEYSQDTGDNRIYWAGWMLEKGTVAHDWSPAPSEAHPLYMGTYTDFTQADSLDPTDYQWSQIKGDKGDTGPQGPPGQDVTITIDSSSQNTNKKPSAYTEGFSYEIKTFDSLGIDKSKISSELVQGKVVWLTTKKYSDYARQMAEVIDSPTPATFFRNGTKDSWSNWVVSQLTAFS